MEKKYSLMVNGNSHEVSATPDTKLIFLLRNSLGLHSPRFGCGNEECGACRVLVGDKLCFSCTVTLAEIENRKITTLEGISADRINNTTNNFTDSHSDKNVLHPLQRAFNELNAGQCGYCLSGILITAFWLLKNNPDPSRLEIQTALDSHLCRCGAHNRIINAIQLAAVKLKDG